MSTSPIAHPGTDDLIYDCPHCGERIEVHETQIGEVIDCPNPACGHPFEVAPPQAHLSRGPAANPQGRVYQAQGRATDAERDLIVRHPAMFRNHPLKYTGLMALFVGGLVIAWICSSIGLLFMAMLGTIAAGCGLLLLGIWYVQTYFETLTVTNRRTIVLRGILSRRTNEVQHDDVRNIQVDQNMLQRLLGVGRIAISSSGQSDLEIDITGIPAPEEIAETIRNYQ